MMKKQLAAVAVASAIGLASSSLVLAQDDQFENEDDRASYALGMMIGAQLGNQFGDVNYDLLLEAMQAQRDGADTRLTVEEAQQTIAERQQQIAEALAAENEAQSAAFLEENAQKDGVTVTESGLQYEVLEEGDGETPSADDTVTVHYVGTLPDGTQFDSSRERGEPTTFPLTNVIPGWTEGLQLMPVGSTYRFVIPSDLAYGERGAGQLIGPGATLVFEVELLEIGDAESSDGSEG